MNKPKHAIKKGPEGGRFQCAGRGKEPRYLLESKVVRGPQGGRFQKYGRGQKRYLLE